MTGGWLLDQVVLVTGGGTGLGRALVGRFLDEGARVGVLEVVPEKATLLRADFGDAVVVVEGDATVLADNQRAVRETVAAFGRLDTFVANAAMWDFGTSLADLPPDAVSDGFDQLFALNVKACLLGAKASLEALRESAGSMIFTLSNAAFTPGGGGPIYTASKHALVGLVAQLAYELAPQVRVNGVAPGGMITDLRGPRGLGLADTSFGSMARDDVMRDFNALDIVPEPADYAGHYVLLASRQNNRTATGSIYRCDAGIAVRRRNRATRASAPTDADAVPKT